MKKIFLVSLMFLATALNTFGVPVTLSWQDNSNNELGFKIERAPGTTTNFVQINNVSTNIVTYTDMTALAGTTYSYRVLSYNSVASSAPSNVATVTTAPPINTLPTIGNILDLSININTNTGPIAFIVGDAETPVANLTLAGVSSNLVLVPNANIVFGGSGANRTVTVTPIAGQIGTTTISVTVSDGTNIKADTFVLTVNQAIPAAPSVLTVTTP